MMHMHLLGQSRHALANISDNQPKAGGAAYSVTSNHVLKVDKAGRMLILSQNPLLSILALPLYGLKVVDILACLC